MIITSTPLRFSIFGGNTDFREYFLNYGGLVLTTTIDKYIYCIVKERFDNQIIVNIIPMIIIIYVILFFVVNKKYLYLD